MACAYTGVPPLRSLDIAPNELRARGPAVQVDLIPGQPERVPTERIRCSATPRRLPCSTTPRSPTLSPHARTRTSRGPAPPPAARIRCSAAHGRLARSSPAAGARPLHLAPLLQPAHARGLRPSAHLRRRRELPVPVPHDILVPRLAVDLVLLLDVGSPTPATARAPRGTPRSRTSSTPAAAAAPPATDPSVMYHEPQSRQGPLCRSR